MTRSDTPASPDPAPAGSPSSAPGRFGRPFWILNGIEMGERLARRWNDMNA